MYIIVAVTYSYNIIVAVTYSYNIIVAVTYSYNIFINARKGKDHGIAVRARNGYSESRGIAAIIPDFSTRWMWVVSFTLHPLYPQDRTPISIGQEVGWDPDQV